jgi:CHAD domain-containing protein
LREVSNELSIRRQRVRFRSCRERVALEQLDKALEHTKAKTKLDEAVHDVRVCFKKLRGLIRLVRDELGDKQYKRENIFYRDLNRRLSKVRDTAALTEILTRLEERFAEELTENAFASVRRSFTARRGSGRLRRRGL